MGESSFPTATSKLMTALTNQLCEGSVTEKVARKVKFNAINPVPYTNIHTNFVSSQDDARG